MQRKSQEMMWDSVTSAIEPRIEEFNERAQQLSANPKGSLELNPILEIPVYHTVADIHLQPGGFHSEAADNDVTAGAVYDNAVPIYSNRTRGPKNDALGQTLVQFFQKNIRAGSPVKFWTWAVASVATPWHGRRLFPKRKFTAWI